MNKVYLTGDIHGDAIARFSKRRNPVIYDTLKIDKTDVVVVLGDCGIVDWPKFERQCDYQCNWLNDRPWTTILLYGNHDNYDAIKKYPVVKKFNGHLRQVRRRIFAVDFPTVLTLQGKKCLLIPGAQSHDCSTYFYPWQKREQANCRKKGIFYRTIYENWWPNETIDMSIVQSMRRTHQLDDVEIVMTHECPDFFPHLDMPRVTGQSFLGTLAAQLDSFTTWFHGHMHENIMYKHECKWKSGEYKDFFCLYNSIIDMLPEDE